VAHRRPYPSPNRTVRRLRFSLWLPSLHSLPSLTLSISAVPTSSSLASAPFVTAPRCCAGTYLTRVARFRFLPSAASLARAAAAVLVAVCCAVPFLFARPSACSPDPAPAPVPLAAPSPSRPCPSASAQLGLGLVVPRGAPCKHKLLLRACSPPSVPAGARFRLLLSAAASSPHVPVAVRAGELLSCSSRPPRSSLLSLLTQRALVPQGGKARSAEVGAERPAEGRARARSRRPHRQKRAAS